MVRALLSALERVREALAERGTRYFHTVWDCSQPQQPVLGGCGAGEGGAGSWVIFGRITRVTAAQKAGFLVLVWVMPCCMMSVGGMCVENPVAVRSFQS